MRLVLICLALALPLLLTGCSKERHASQAAQAAPSPPASTPDAPPGATPTPVAVAIASSGCGMEIEADASVGSLESAGIERSYRLYIPAGYRPGTPAPLVINYHGLGGNALEQESYAEYPAAADKYGFIVVSPEATGSPSEWFLYGAIEEGYVDDFAFTGRLLDELSANLCIDENRIYATGVSNGGGMTSLAGCVLSDRIAAIAPVAGSPYTEPACGNAGPVPIIAFHGTDDPLVPFEYSEDVGRLDIFRFGARNNMVDWARHNGCDPTLNSQRVAEDVVLESYGDCRDGADVQLYVIEGGGHTWPGTATEKPGLGGTTHSISATELSWLFFAAHPKR